MRRRSSNGVVGRATDSGPNESTGCLFVDSGSSYIERESISGTARMDGASGRLTSILILCRVQFAKVGLDAVLFCRNPSLVKGC